MEIEPPPPTIPETGKVPHSGRGLMSALLMWLGLLVAITLIAWVLLWSGGVKEAAPADKGTGAAQTEQPQQRS